MINFSLLLLLLLVSAASDILLLIILSIGTFNYDLARFICDLLSPIVPDDYSCKDTFSFVLT